MKTSIRKNLLKSNFLKTQSICFFKTRNSFSKFNKLNNAFTPNLINFNYKILSKRFSSFIEKDDMKILENYKKKIDSSENILEEIFAKSFSKRADAMEYFNFDLISKNIKIEDSIGLESMKASIFEPCWDMIDRGGKRWRPMLGLIIADLFKVNLENPSSDEAKKLYYKLIYLVEVLHNSSLILDDVEDKSEQRRNKPCIHLTYGEAIAINAGISLMFFPMHYIISRVEDPLLSNSLSKCYFQEITAVHLGQGWDIEMKIASRVPTINTYRDTVLMKTGVFPRLIVKFLNVLVKYSYEKNNADKKDLDFIDELFEILLNVVDNMSIAFQIKDDLLNITESELSKRKGFFGEDIFEGKLTLMIIHTLNLKGDKYKGNRLKEILAMNTKNPDLINEAVEILKANGSIQYGEDIMNQNVNISVDFCKDLQQKITKAGKENVLDLNSIRNIKLLLFYLIDRKI